MTEDFKAGMVLDVRPQQIAQLDQQGGEAAILCDLGSGKEHELARVGGERRVDQPRTAPAGGGDAGLLALHLSNAIWIAVHGNGAPLIDGGKRQGELAERHEQR